MVAKWKNGTFVFHGGDIEGGKKRAIRRCLFFSPGAQRESIGSLVGLDTQLVAASGWLLMGPLTVSGVCPSECVFFPGRPPTTTTDLLSSSRFLLLLFHRRLTISLFIARPYNNARFLHRGRCLSPSRKERVKKEKVSQKQKKTGPRGVVLSIWYI